MMKKILSIALISTILLSACLINIIQDDKNREDKDKKQTQTQELHNNKNHNQNTQQNEVNQSTQNNEITQQTKDNQSTHNNTQELSEAQAIQKAKNVFSSGAYHEFNIDRNRTNDQEYVVTFLLNDAVGFPMKAATTVNKTSGEVGNLIDDRTEADKQNHIQHANESSMYKGNNSKNKEIYGRDFSRPNDKVMEEQKRQNNSNQSENN